MIPRGTRPTMQTLPAITRTHTKRARTQIADRPARQFVPVPLGLSPERYAFGMIYLIFTLQQKPIWSHAREGVSTSGICWDEGDAFLQPMRSRKTVLSRRELRTTPLRSMAPCAEVFTSYAGEFDNKQKTPVAKAGVRN